MNTVTTMLNNTSGLTISPRLAKNLRRNLKERVICLLYTSPPCFISNDRQPEICRSESACSLADLADGYPNVAQSGF